MICHIVEMNVKPGRVWDLCPAIRETLGIWRSALGFIDELVMADPDANRVIAQSFWRSMQNGEDFDRQNRARITGLMQEFLAGPPTSATYRLAVSTNRNLVPGQDCAEAAAKSWR